MCTNGQSVTKPDEKLVLSYLDDMSDGPQCDFSEDLLVPPNIQLPPDEVLI